MVTDRPDFTEASTTVGLGVAQIEMGWTRTRDRGADGVTEHDGYPETLLRVGVLAEWLELRVGWNYGEQQDNFFGGGALRREGAEDLYLGMKIALTPQSGLLPEMAIIPQMNIPTGSGHFTADEVQPGVNWLYAWDITECLACGGSTQGNRVLDEDGHGYLELAQSFTVGLQLTEQVAAYSEWFAFFPHSAQETGVGAEHYYNGGFTFLVNDDVQLDLRAGVGLNRRADDSFFGAGVSMRY